MEYQESGDVNGWLEWYDGEFNMWDVNSNMRNTYTNFGGEIFIGFSLFSRYEFLKGRENFNHAARNSLAEVAQNMKKNPWTRYDPRVFNLIK